MDTRLYVGNLSFDATEEDLKELFEQAGSVLEVVVMRDKFSGRSRGFAFVSMASTEDANKAISQLNDYEFAGRKLQINAARPKEDRPERSHRDSSRGGPRGGNGGGRSFGGGGGFFKKRGGGGFSGGGGGSRGGFRGGRSYGDE
jgi:RNA recognition motif-containing protein